jgi:hypothetical protein
MEKEIKEILRDYMTERQIELALPRLVNFISSNTMLADATREKNLVKCSNCDEMVEMISSGEFCPHCFC